MTDANKWCHDHFAATEVMGWLRYAGIGTMDDFWDKCRRGDRMLWALSECRLDRSAEMSRLEFAARCAERALDREQRKGRKPDRRLWVAIRMVRKFIRGGAGVKTVRAAIRLAYDVPLITHPSADAAAHAVVYTINAALEVAKDSSDISGYVTEAATAAVRAVALDDLPAGPDELPWQADTLRKLLQPDGGKR